MEFKVCDLFNIRRWLKIIKDRTKVILGVYDVKDLYIGSRLGSYSQYGEDIIIHHILKKISSGVYVDVGANHPTRLNNTLLLYRMGWSGINIEPQVDLCRVFDDHRPNDINLNIGISEVEGSLIFYKMSMDTLSTFDKYSAIRGGKVHGAQIVEEISVPVIPLSKVFEEHLNNRRIDFLSVDVEGFDLNVLQSCDWNIYRPKVVMVEINQDRNRILEFMSAIGYDLCYDNKTNGIFIVRGYTVD